MPLTPAQVQTIKATIPILKEGGVALTTKFYQNMFHNNPEVLPYFNQAHQKSGAQPRALAHAVLMYATYIDDLSKLGDLVNRITAKHVVLDVPASGYPIVGQNLIATIKEVLGPEIANEQVIDAWTAAYGDLANLLIDIEEKMYQAGEWRGYRPFVVKDKVLESPDVVSVYVTPADGKGIKKQGKPGQYIGIKVDDAEAFKESGGSTRREYTLTGQDADHFRISVKRIPDGVFSNYVHDKLQVGQNVEIAPPQGDFVVEDAAQVKKAVFLCGGIGVTPVLSLAKQLVNAGTDVTIAYSVHSHKELPFTKEFDELRNASAKIVHYFTKEDGSNSSLPAQSKAGKRIEFEDVKELTQDGDSHVFYLGPMSFMADVSKYLQDLSIPQERIHREFFLPDQSIVC